MSEQDIPPGVASESVAPRRISVPLMVGLMTLPTVFVWFMLRRGYARSTRNSAFAYTAILFGFGLIGRFGHP